MSQGKAPLGCIVCRSRKVRCDRTSPSCRNCMRLGVACPGFGEGQQAVSRKQMLKSTEDIFKAAGKDKRRIGSCSQCRASKSSCSRERPSCKRCSSRRLNCVYRAAKSDKESSREPSSIGHPHSSPRSPTLSRRKIVFPGQEIDYEMLCSESLPEDAALQRQLINTYFERIHPLRCLGFIHKPSFMHSLDLSSLVQDYSEPLIYIICALGARVLYFDLVRSHSLVHIPGDVIPGEAWAEKARRGVLLEAHLPTLQHLMTMILLCEYGLRSDNNAQTFLLSGYLFRTLRLMGLDLPHQQSLTAETKNALLEGEIGKRVVWECYHIDVLISSGVDRNSLWRDDVPQIPLPCPNQDFIALSGSQAHYLTAIDELLNETVVGHVDLPSLVTILATLRSMVLRLIRTTLPLDVCAWEFSSPFMVMIQRLQIFHDSLPQKFRLTELNLYALKDQHLIGAVFLLHMLYHAAVFDLARISLSGFNFPLADSLRDAPAEVRFELQKRCNFHASEISNIIGQAFVHGIETLDQPICPAIALESAKIQIVYSATVNNNFRSIEIAKHNIMTNLRLLKFLHSGKEGQSIYIRTLLPLCNLFGLPEISREWSEHEAQCSLDACTEVSGSADIHYLSNVALFRKARSELQASKASCTSSNATSLSSGPAGPSNVDGSEETHHLLPDLVGPATATADSGNIEIERNPESTQNNLTAQPSIEDYIRTADCINDYLTWNIFENPELPSWTSLDIGGDF